MPAGRPKIEIDAQKFEYMCSLQSTLDEIAGLFDCSPDTVERWCKRTYGENFAEAYKKHSAKGKMSLRRAQFRLAEKSAAMAIFLGKQYLGQTDHVIVEDKSAIERLDEILKGTHENAVNLQRQTE